MHSQRENNLPACYSCSFNNEEECFERLQTCRQCVDLGPRKLIDASTCKVAVPALTLLHPSSLVLCLSSCLARPLFSPSLSPLSHTTRGWRGAESVCWVVISTAAILNVVCGGGDKISQRHAPAWISGSMFCSLLSARKM